MRNPTLRAETGGKVGSGFEVSAEPPTPARRVSPSNGLSVAFRTTTAPHFAPPSPATRSGKVGSPVSTWASARGGTRRTRSAPRLTVNSRALSPLRSRTGSFNVP